MLAPVAEAAYGEQALLALSRASLERWPSFARELEQASGLPVGLRTAGTLVVGFDADDLDALAELHAFQAGLGLPSERLTGRECRRREPPLTPRLRGGLAVPGDHSVDPRALPAALRVAAERAGVRLVEQRVTRPARSRPARAARRRDGRWRGARRRGRAGARRRERRAAGGAAGAGAGAPGQGAGAAAARRAAARRHRAGAGARPLGLPRAVRRRPAGRRRDRRGAGLRPHRHRRRRPRPAARRGRGGARRHRARAGRDPRRLAPGHARQRARCSAPAACPDSCSPPATTATACCSPR